MTLIIQIAEPFLKFYATQRLGRSSPRKLVILVRVFMFDYPILPASLRDRVLHYLDCPSLKPGTQALNNLINAYVQKVPWESAFRIVKQRSTPVLADRPRWPEEFWCDAIGKGGGGTCFESNYAFLALLLSLGYEGYLTINNMAEFIGSHTAIILWLQGQKRVVDVGIPLHKSLLLHTNQVTRSVAYFHTYFVQPKGEELYEIKRTNHLKRNIYTLVDQPISNQRYRMATTQDYGEQGLFLDRVIITKVIEGKVWRFTSDHRLHLEVFDRKSKTEILLPESLLARRLARHFDMDRVVIEAALAAVTGK